MRKKNVWVVTQVIVGRVSFTVDTYVIGWFHSLNEAKRFIEEEYKKLYKLSSNEPSTISRNDRGLTYKSEYVISQIVINRATGV